MHMVDHAYGHTWIFNFIEVFFIQSLALPPDQQQEWIKIADDMPKPIFDHFLGTGYFASSHQMASAILRKLLSVLSAISSKKR